MSVDSRDRHALTGELLADANHECNNQLAFLLSNLQNLVEYADDLAKVLAAYRARVPQDPEIQRLEAQTDLDFLLSDVGRAAREGLAGATRLRDILRVLARLGEEEPAEPAIVELGKLVRQVLSIQGKPIGIRARLEVEAETPGNVSVAPTLLMRSVVIMVKHALGTFDPARREQSILRVRVHREDGRMAVIVERVGARPADGVGLEPVAAAAERLPAELRVEPLRTILLLPEAT